jgi:hypothetical protein
LGQYLIQTLDLGGDEVGFVPVRIERTMMGRSGRSGLQSSLLKSEPPPSSGENRRRRAIVLAHDRRRRKILIVQDIVDVRAATVDCLDRTDTAEIAMLPARCRTS